MLSEELLLLDASAIEVLSPPKKDYRKVSELTVGLARD